MRACAVVCVVACACGRVDFDAVGPGGASVQRGTVTMTSETTLDITVDDVPPERSVLVFGVAEATGVPSVGHVAGNLVGGSTLELTRAQGGETVTISWYLVTFAHGVSVQRGSVPKMAGLVADVPIAAADPATSFVLISLARMSVSYSADDIVRASLTSPEQLELTSGGVNLGDLVDWQVVTIDDATVEQGDVVLDAPDVSIAVDALSRAGASFPVATWTELAGPVSGLLGSRCIRVRLADGQLMIDRELAANPLEVSWSVITIPAVSTQAGNASFGATDTTLDVSIDPVDLDRSIAFLAANQLGGATPFVGATGDQTVGVAWFTSELVDAQTLRLTRGTTRDEPADAAWFVVELP